MCIARSHYKEQYAQFMTQVSADIWLVLILYDAKGIQQVANKHAVSKADWMHKEISMKC